MSKSMIHKFHFIHLCETILVNHLHHNANKNSSSTTVFLIYWTRNWFKTIVKVLKHSYKLLNKEQITYLQIGCSVGAVEWSHYDYFGRWLKTSCPELDWCRQQQQVPLGTWSYRNIRKRESEWVGKGRLSLFSNSNWACSALI